jgi:hypothetical protein
MLHRSQSGTDMIGVISVNIDYKFHVFAAKANNSYYIVY